MSDSVFTSLINYSMNEARSQFADHLNDTSTLELVKDNPTAFCENLSFGHAALFMSAFVDCTLQNYHKFFCIILKEKGIDISNLQDFEYLLKE